MPNVFKAFLWGGGKDAESKVKPYQFPAADELVVEPDPQEEAPALDPELFPSFDGEEPEEGAGGAEGFDAAAAGEPQAEEPEPEPEPEPEENPISFAQLQAEAILAEARQDAERILKQARDDADKEAGNVFAKAREEGYQEGYVAGMAQAAQESKAAREEQAKRQEEEVHRFMEQAGLALDRQMDQSVDDLRDLALAVAEKVVCVSLKSSADVISRMIQTAIDKRKKKEWVHIYISECDAKRLTQIPASLSAALSALSDRVRIIPMSDDESGTCIIEMPDEIVDASTSTQLNNLRTILMDTANSASGINLFH